ncbi:AGE family epimerase/isomerase [Roseibium sp.]|uniref:AGE family epimerase/isomerase n=1 Tax=Roseibium sp. TaxID=1936156 RepID=UPI003A96B1F8
MVDELAELSHRLHSWVLTEGFPLWWDKGAAPNGGGFYEALDASTTPDTITPLEYPRRARVQPRQIYCYISAQRLGWQGPWRRAVDHGVGFYEGNYRLEDGTYAALVDGSGKILKRNFNLYDQAFALFALSHMAQALPDQTEQFCAQAERLLDVLYARFHHCQGGFHESDPPTAPLGANPHMHLLEAALAWEETGLPPGPRFAQLADEIVDLCLTKFISSETGAVREDYDLNWQAYDSVLGRRIEPGHQFEWAWLLLRWSLRRDDPRILTIAQRLFSNASHFGVCRRRQVAIMALNDDFSPQDEVARLWAQTEWLKSALLLAHLTSGIARNAYRDQAISAGRSLERFLSGPVPGTWYDKIEPDDSFRAEASPASSFYHIVGAILELTRLSPSLAR